MKPLSNDTMFCPTSGSSPPNSENVSYASRWLGAPASIASLMWCTACAPGSMRAPAGSATKVERRSSSHPSNTRTAPISITCAAAPSPVVSRS